MRTPEERRRHAGYERKYRAQKRAERDRALGNFAGSAMVLMERHGYTLGQLVDIISEREDTPDERR